MFNRKICDRVPEPVKRNLENDVIQGMIQDGEPVYGYRSPEYVKDVGTVDRIQQTLKDIERGFIAEKSLSRKQKCIFLDRDGTINQYRGLVYRRRTLSWSPARSGGETDQPVGPPGDRHHQPAGGGPGPLRDRGCGKYPPEAVLPSGEGGRVPGRYPVLPPSPGQRDTRRRIRLTRSPVSAGSQRTA